MSSIDDIREFWANIAPSPDCCTTSFGKTAAEHVATLLAETKRLRESEIEWGNKAWDLSKELVEISEIVRPSQDESIIHAVRDEVDELNRRRRENDMLRHKLELMDTMFLRCAHCGADLLAPDHPPHCHDCVITEEDEGKWRENTAL